MTLLKKIESLIDKVNKKVKIVKHIPHTVISLIFMGAVQSLYFALLLLGIRQGRARLNRLLAALLVAVSFGFISVFGLMNSAGPIRPALFRVMLSMSLFCIPLLYIYIRALMREDFFFSPAILLHFLPVALLIVVSLIFCRLSGDFSVFALNHISVIMAIWLLYLLPYLFSIYLIMKEHHRRLTETYRTEAKITRQIIYQFRVYLWVRSLLFAGSIYWIFTVIFFFYRDIQGFYAWLTWLSTATIYVLGFLGIRKPEVFLVISLEIGEEAT